MEQACSRSWIGDPFDERGEKEMTVKREEGRHRAKPFGPRVSEIRHRANFPKAERWLSPRRVHGQSWSKFNFSTANRVPPASWELLPRVSTTTLLLSLSRDSPSVIPISSFSSSVEKAPEHRVPSFPALCSLLDQVLKHFHLSISGNARRLHNAKLAASDFPSNRTRWSIERG